MVIQMPYRARSGVVQVKRGDSWVKNKVQPKQQGQAAAQRMATALNIHVAAKEKKK